VLTRLLLEGPAIEPLLARVHAEHGPRARIVKAERVRAGGFGGFFARERFEVTVEVDGAEPGAAPAMVDLVAPPVAPGDAGTSAADLLLAAADAGDVSQVTRLPVLGAPVAAVPPVTSKPAVAATSPVTAAPTATAADTPTAEVPLTPAKSAFAAVLGGAAVVEDVTRRVPELLGALPEAPPLTLPGGGVVAVVGSGRAVMRAAQAVAERLHLGPEAVLRAGSYDPSVPAWQRLTGAVDAATRAARARRYGSVTVVAVDVELEPDGHPAARDVLRALAADRLIACVDATRRPADTAAFLRSVTGGLRVDALAVHAATASSEPEAVLELGIPVALLDGRASTPAAWTALLMEQGPAPAQVAS